MGERSRSGGPGHDKKKNRRERKIAGFFPSALLVLQEFVQSTTAAQLQFVVDVVQMDFAVPTLIARRDAISSLSSAAASRRMSSARGVS